LITKENREKHLVLLVHGHGGQNVTTLWMDTDTGVKDWCQKCSTSNLLSVDMLVEKAKSLRHAPGISIYPLHCRTRQSLTPPPTLLTQPLGNDLVRVCMGALPGFRVFSVRPLDPPASESSGRTRHTVLPKQ
ncbi:hypothetical protein PMAYCL1PPCAC_25640, partial [Pristionchus mayeri]